MGDRLLALPTGRSGAEVAQTIRWWAARQEDLTPQASNLIDDPCDYLADRTGTRLMHHREALREGLPIATGVPHPTGIPGSSSFQVEEVAFVKDSEGNWVLVIQTGGTVDGSQATVVQFASYDPSVTPPPTASAAVSYLDERFALAGK